MMLYANCHKVLTLRLNSRHLFLALVAFWSVASWMAATWYTNKKVDTLLSSSQNNLAGDSLAAFQAFEERLNLLATVPMLSGELPAVTQAAARYAHDPAQLKDLADRQTYWINRPDLRALNKQLAELAEELNLDLAFVLNADGYSIASSNSDTAASTVGTRYLDRRYFSDAIVGSNAYQYAVGRTTNIPGLFYSAPIRANGAIVGVFVIKSDISRLQTLLAPYNAFLADSNGVVVLSSNPALLQRRLENPDFSELSEEQRLQQYKRIDFPILQVTPWNGDPEMPLLRLDDLPYPVLTTDRGMPIGNLTLHSYQSVPELLTVQFEQIALAIMLALAGLAAFTLSYQLLHYLRRLRLSKAEAEEESEQLQITLTDREREIRRLAFVDALTNLPNRNALRQHLNRAIREASHRGHFGAMYLVNLDGLKLINDRLGHEAGDQLLVALAERLCVEMDSDCYVARLGGDEFVVIHETGAISTSEAEQDIQAFGSQLLNRITAPYVINDHTIHLTASVGVTLFGPGLVNTPDALYKEVDAAMFEAKHSQRGGIHFFDEQVREALATRAELTNRLLNALRNSQFDQLYQPQMDVHGHVAGVEALIRWHDTELGSISPATFVPLAESLHIIADIDRWVLDRACRTARSWRDDPVLRKVPISVNVSGEYFSMAGFIDEVMTALATHAVEPQQLMIELTEGTLIMESERTRQNIIELHRQGILVAIDDFGTGNSSLSYMQRFSVDQLKIDQSFVRDMLIDERSLAVVEFIIQLANSLKYHTLAEGVETPAQHEKLLALGCNLFQGYLFSKALPKAECESFIRQSLI